MDETIVDTMTRHLDWYNKEFNQQLTKTDLQGTKIYHRVPSDHVASVRAYPDHPEFFVDITPYDDALSVIEQLHQRYDILIATAAMEHPTSFTPKYNWLVKHLPFLSPMNFVFCGDKSAVHADYLIDDSPRHFERFRGEGILFTAPHNVAEKRYRRVDNWGQVKEMFL